ncbi:BTAD domain-containing putative transcriptional regulator [Actinoplanes sp. NPDC051859]|uniref:AfsR/SARP family transcriptional regulator n=1 Tax=Actinoplanes sp. NPDC051859 TaxID=3363909 RepID=UPI0037AA4E74
MALRDTDAALRFRILGRVTATRGPERLHCGGPKQRALLAVLLLNANRPVSMSRLADLIWWEAEPKSAAANLRTYVAGLRQAIGGERILARPGAYEIRVLPGEFDAHDFAELVARGRAALAAGSLDLGVDALGRALALWDGRAGEDVPRAFALDNLFTILDEERLAVFEDWASALIAVGQTALAVPALRRFLSEHPYRERAWRHLMEARYRCGDAAGAIATFQRVRAVLLDQLGLEPGVELVELHRAILRRDPLVPAGAR